MFKAGLKAGASEAAAGAALDITMQAGVGVYICESLGNSNPFKDCIKRCGTKDRKNSCIIEEGCYEKDEQGKPLFEDKSLKKECYENIATDGIDYEALKVNLLYKDVPVGIAEGMARNYLAKQAGKSFADDSLKEFARLNKNNKNLMPSNSKSSRIIKGSKEIIQKGANKIGQGISKAGRMIGISKGVGKTSVKGATAGILKQLSYNLAGSYVGKKFLQAMASQPAKQAALALAKAVNGAGIALGMIDGAAIVLGMWDPGGWEATVNKEDIEQMKNETLKSYHRMYDNKAIFSEPAKQIKREAEYELKMAKKEYNKNKTEQNRIKVEEADIKLKAAINVMFKMQFKGKDRPLSEGGPLLYPVIITPNYPFTENNQWIPGLENIYAGYMQEYLDKNNLVLFPDELEYEKIDKDIEKLNKQTDTILEKSKNNTDLKKIQSKSSYNLSSNEVNLIKSNIKKKEKISKELDKAIKEIEDRKNRFDLRGDDEEAKELEETLNKLKKNKEETNKLINNNSSILNEIDENKRNATILLARKKKQRQIMFALLVIIVILGFLYLKKRNKKIY